MRADRCVRVDSFWIVEKVIRLLDGSSSPATCASPHLSTGYPVNLSQPLFSFPLILHLSTSFLSSAPPQSPPTLLPCPARALIHQASWLSCYRAHLSTSFIFPRAEKCLFFWGGLQRSRACFRSRKKWDMSFLVLTLKTTYSNLDLCRIHPNGVYFGVSFKLDVPKWAPNEGSPESVNRCLWPEEVAALLWAPSRFLTLSLRLSPTPQPYGGESFHPLESPHSASSKQPVLLDTQGTVCGMPCHRLMPRMSCCGAQGFTSFWLEFRHITLVIFGYNGAKITHGWF